ncbi:DVU0298 family protein [Thermodesulfobacteriota bacterium]
MMPEKIGGKKLKHIVFTLLSLKDFEGSLKELSELPPRQVVNPLFSFFYHLDDLIRWRAIAAMGVSVANLAYQDMESARVVMRRLIWNLNDESGGIGWGSPEALGEIMACHEKLAQEYSRILVSYFRKDGNYIEYEPLQRGVIWGLARLAHERPELLITSTRYILPYLVSGDATIRGFAAWASGALDAELTRPFLEQLVDDPTKIIIFLDRQLQECTIASLAKEALKNHGSP